MLGHDDDYEFDAEAAVVEFRETILKRDAATTPEAFEELDCSARHQREAWQKWQGEDSLFEMAFGEWAGRAT